MAAPKKDKNKKKSGMLRKLFNRKPKDAVANTKNNNNDDEVPQPSGRRSFFGSFTGSKPATDKKAAKADKKAAAKAAKAKAKTKGKGKAASKKEAFPPRKGKKPKFQKKKTVRKPRKVGNKTRGKNKFYPGKVDFKYTSTEEVWVENLGRDIKINDFGDNARIILDETDK